MSDDWIPISHANCKQVAGPFFHGTQARLQLGDLLTTGHRSHFEAGRTLKHVYFSALLEPAIWGAELAMALSKREGRGQGHPAGMLQAMLDSLEELRRRGLAVIEG